MSAYLVLGRWVAAVAGYRPVSRLPDGRAVPARPHPWPADGHRRASGSAAAARVGPVQWRGIAVTRSSYLVSHVTLVPPTVSPPDVIAKGLDTPQVHALRTSRLVRLFLDRALFPWSTPPTTARIVRYVDLRATGDGRPAPVGPRRAAMRRATCKRLSSSIASFCRPLRTFNL